MSNLTDWMGKCHELEGEVARLKAELSTSQRTAESFAEETARLHQWNADRAGQFACTEQRLASRIAVLENRLHWLHQGNSTDPEGYEWGIYRVKWENGVAVSVMNTFSDLSDLDAEISREEKAKSL